MKRADVFFFLFVFCFFSQNCTNFVPLFCSDAPFGDRIKRESGGNPGQSRCCNLRRDFVSDVSVCFVPLLFCGKAMRTERVRRPARQFLTVGFRGKGFGSSDRHRSLVLLQLFFQRGAVSNFLMNVQDTA